MSNIENASEQLICLYERVSGCEVSEIINTDLEYLADVIEGEMDANESCIKDLIKQLVKVKAQRDKWFGLLQAEKEITDQMHSELAKQKLITTVIERADDQLSEEWVLASKEELEGRLMSLLHPGTENWCMSECGKFVYDCGPTGDAYYKVDLINIDNWNDIMPILLSLNISYEPCFDGEYIAHQIKKFTFDEYPDSYDFETKLPDLKRALIICCIKALEASSNHESFKKICDDNL